MPEPIRCDACDRRIVVGPVLRDDDGNRYGPRCGRTRGLAPEKRVRARKPAPVRAEQPALAGWNEIEINEEDTVAETTTDLCRCPDGWPTPMATFRAGESVVVLRHHLGDCGLPDETVDDECEGAP